MRSMASFTLADLVSYDSKHNGANGEDNRDGTDDNRSWNCGAGAPPGQFSGSVKQPSAHHGRHPQWRLRQ